MRARAGWFGAALAICVGVVAGWVALAGRQGDVGGPPAPSTGPLSIWPESPFDPPDTLRLAQARVDGGRDPWRQRADAVTARFARSLFGWDRIELVSGGDGLIGGPERHRIRPVCTTEECAEGDDWIGVAVDRLGRQGEGGIWSVVEVTSERLGLPVASGAIVTAGQELTVRLDLLDDEHAAVGIRYAQQLRGGTSPDCGDGFEGRVGLAVTEGIVVVPDPLFDDGACADAGAVGYVFAYSTPRLTVQTGDPLLEPAAISGLAAVPVHLSQDPMGGVADPDA